MALRLCQPTFNALSKTLIRLNIKACIAIPSVSYSSQKGDECVVITDDSRTIVCWHPEKPFPYDCSQPLPTAAPESMSVLNIQFQEGVSNLMKPKSKEAVREELMKLTYTTKHRWFPRSRDKYFKKIPNDREYL